MGSGALMGIQDVGLLSSRASFFTSFPKDGGRSKGIRKATCHRTVFGGKQGHAPTKILSLQQSLFCIIEFCGGHNAVMK